MCRFLLCIGVLTYLNIGLLSAQQVADTSFQVDLATKSFPNNDGPVIVIDEGHHNFHTIDGRYQTFAWILRKDGYQVKGHKGKFTKQSLAASDVLVIVNAIHKRNVKDWSLPNPSAFTNAEIDAVEAWVRAGGRLFLIADHMPFPGAAHELASRFGFEMTNSFAFDKRKRNPEIFVRADSSLVSNLITDGRLPEQRIDTVVTFTGQGFYIPAEASPILSLTDDYILALPEVAWQFEERTEFRPATNTYQLAYRDYGKGKIVVSGEAAMFSAQISQGKYKMGLNQPVARQNIQLLLNIANWLTAK